MSADAVVASARTGLGALRLLTVGETADALRVSSRHVRSLVAKGEIPPIRIGRCVRIKRDALEMILSNGIAPEGAR